MKGRRPARAQPFKVRPKNLQGVLDLPSLARSPDSPSDFVVDCDEDLDGVGGAGVEGGGVGVVLSAFIVA